MSSEELKDVAEGITTGFLSWSSEQIKSFVSRLKDKKLAFIQDEKTIQTVKELYSSGELSIYKEYIEDKEILFLLKMGLTLRKLEQEGEIERRQNLRTKIFNKYAVKGLHIAQFVENGILNRYIGILIDNIISLDKFRNDIMNVLKNIEKHVLFVKNDDKEREIIKSALSIVTSNIPFIFIISGISSAAGIVKSCEARLTELLKDYELEKISSGQKENLFFKRVLRK